MGGCGAWARRVTRYRANPTNAPHTSSGSGGPRLGCDPRAREAYNVRLASYQIGNTQGYGAVVGDGIVDLGRRLTRYPTLRELIAGAILALHSRKLLCPALP